MSKQTVQPAVRRGFSLLEMVVSLGATSLLVAGVASTVYIASRGTRSEDSPTARVVEAAMSVDEFAAELQYATGFSERSATAVEFTVADRTGDGQPETIRYAWTGTAGDPITRSVNGGTPVDAVPAAEQLLLSYNVQTVSETSTEEGTSGESDEVLLAHFNGWSGVTATELEHALSTTSWLSEYFPVNWPVGAPEVRVTRVRLKLRKSTDGAQMSVGIYPAVAGSGPLPEDTPIGSLIIQSSNTLPSSFGWMEFTFNDVVLANPDVGYNLVVKGFSSGVSVQYLRSFSAPDDATVAKYTTNGGGSWAPSSFQEKYYDMPFYVYGRYPTNDAPQESNERYFMRTVGITLEVTGDASRRVDTAVDIVNAPEVASP